MVDFVKESRKASVDKSFKDLQEQRINQFKTLEKWDITNTLSEAVSGQVKKIKKSAKETAKTNAAEVSGLINLDLDHLHVYVKGKVSSGIKETYAKEDAKLKNL